jgi:hypothetical protein
MASGLAIKVVDPDNDYLGIEIRASNESFGGSARIYAGLDQLSDFAARIAGFPTNAQDQRLYEFGSREPSIAGGYGRLFFRCIEPSGQAIVEIGLEDAERQASGMTHFSFPVEPAAVDRFTHALREIEHARSGVAVLPASG